MKMLDNGIFENEYIINIAQIGIHKTLTNKSFLSLMENLAGAHSAYCHFSFEDLEKDNLGWIILSWKIKVFKRGFKPGEESLTIYLYGETLEYLMRMENCAQ